VESSIFWYVVPCNLACLSPSSDRGVIQATIEQQSELLLDSCFEADHRGNTFLRNVGELHAVTWEKIAYILFNELLNNKTGGKNSYHCQTSNNIAASPQYEIISTRVIL
jgi:hypothetical protein